MIKTPVPSGLENIKVSNLFSDNRRAWDADIIRDIFNSEDADRILRIPLSFNLNAASWLWLEDEKGQYTVKSGYRLLGKMNHQTLPASPGFNWLKLWSLAVPPKVKNFIWRAIRNCIPTLENLRSKNVEVYPICPVCHSEVESVDHILLSCQFTQLCWEKCELSQKMVPGVALGLQFSQLFATMKNQELEMLCSVAWNIWSHRNMVVWNHRRQTPNMVVNGAGSTLFQWQQAQSNRQNDLRYNKREGAVTWQKPERGWMTCNVDAAVNIQKASSSFGCVLRNEDGNFVAAYGGKLDGIMDPKIAEALAFREALSWLKNRNSPLVCLELDSLGVVNAFHSKLVDYSYFGSIIEDCRSTVKDLRSYSIYFVRRSANVVAHHLAREASSLSDHKEWLSVPSFLIDVILKDMQ